MRLRFSLVLPSSLVPKVQTPGMTARAHSSHSHCNRIEDAEVFVSKQLDGKVDKTSFKLLFTWGLKIEAGEPTTKSSYTAQVPTRKSRHRSSYGYLPTYKTSRSCAVRARNNCHEAARQTRTRETVAQVRGLNSTPQNSLSRPSLQLSNEEI